ncbi:MAG: phosphate transporter periplasmic phosphate-binding protein [Acidimicrobiales bacterium]|nr:phosphate transporter periplasmic phosphate-binding protein [Acidimicrobiales bacterium]
MNGRPRLASLLTIVGVIALLAAGCGSSERAVATPDGGVAPDTDGFDKLSGSIHGGGSSFQDTFEQLVASDFSAVVQSVGGDVTINYTKSGSSDGKKSLADRSVDFAGSDSPIKDEEKAGFGDRQMLYFPIMGGPITVAFNVEGLDTVNLSPDTLAGIFQAQIITWADDAIAADNPGVDLPSTKITVVHRSDGSGTTSNFTKYLEAAAPDTWKLGAGETVNWPTSTQGAEKNTGVTTQIADTEGAIGYADLADAAKELLSVARIGNAAGEFARPTPDNASTALGAAEIADDLTYDPLDVDAPGAYPITSPTWIIVDAEQDDQGRADIIKAYLRYMLTTGQAQAKALLYAPLPQDLATKALAHVDDITVA